MIGSVSDFAGGGPHKAYNFKLALGGGLGSFLTILSTVISTYGIVSGSGIPTVKGQGKFSAADIYPASLKGFGLADGFNIGAGATKIVSDVAFQTRFVYNNKVLEYICDLAERVTLPKYDVSFEHKQLGMVTDTVITKADMLPVSVVYVEDDEGTVERFHREWQSYILRFGSMLRSSSANPAGAYSLPLAYTPLFEDGSENTANQVIFPRVFPASIEVSGGDVTSEDFTKITVSYERTPLFLGPSLLWPVITHGQLHDAFVSAEGSGGGGGGG